MLSQAGQTNLSTLDLIPGRMMPGHWELGHDFWTNLLGIFAKPATYSRRCGLHIHSGIQPWQVFLPFVLILGPLAASALTFAERTRCHMGFIIKTFY